jgi:SRSO17 transposase
MAVTLLTTTPVLDVMPTDLASIMDELRACHAIFSPLFARREQREWATTYLQGLLLDIPRTSIEPVVLHLRGADRNAVHTLQQFVSIGAGDDGSILTQFWREIAADLGDDDGVLVVDGSDFPKRGSTSVGVKRQYCSQLGKMASCQAGGFLAYASAQGNALLDRRLYLPEEWLSDAYAERRADCGVPPDVTVMTKPMLSLAMVQQVVRAGSLPCRWVAGDEPLGGNPALLDVLGELGLWHVMEVARDTRVWRERPATTIPPWSGRGCKPRKARPADDVPPPISVADLAAALPASAWQAYTIKEGSQGPLVAKCALQRVVAVRDGLPGPTVWLVLRRSLTDGKLKTFLSNAPADLALPRLVRTSGMQWPIETRLEVGKQKLGMGDYEIRSWRGWHHHMILVIPALGFLVRLQGRFEQTLRPWPCRRHNSSWRPSSHTQPPMRPGCWRCPPARAAVNICCSTKPLHSWRAIPADVDSRAGSVAMALGCAMALAGQKRRAERLCCGAGAQEKRRRGHLGPQLIGARLVEL